MSFSIENMSFEEAYAQLENIVQQLEMGELSLEDSLKLFEDGQALSRHCQKILDAAELQVTNLMEPPSDSPD